MILDGHVHLVGNGSSGSGCWLAGRGGAFLVTRAMVRSLGLPADALARDFDRLYAERLTCWVREASLDGVLLYAQDEVYAPDGSRRPGVGTFHVPNRYLFEVCRREPRLLPVCSIHPGRADALEELDRCLEAGAVAMKLLPNCHGVDCREPRYRRFWEAMAAARLPLIAHAGPEFLLQEPRRDLRHPRHLRGALDCGVTVIAAHCAVGRGLLARDSFEDWRQLLGSYGQLYGDLSALPLLNRVHRLRDCLRPELVVRVVQGSDFPVMVPILPSLLAGLVNWRQYRSLRRIANPIERDLQLKRAIGFPEAVFTRLSRLIRRSGPSPLAAAA